MGISIRYCPDAVYRNCLPSSAASDLMGVWFSSSISTSNCTWFRNSVTSYLLMNFISHSMLHPCFGSSGPYATCIWYIAPTVDFLTTVSLSKPVSHPCASMRSDVGITSANGSSVTPSLYSSSMNSYSVGGIPSDTCVYVFAFIGNGNSSTIQTLLDAPPVFHPMRTVSHVSPAALTSSTAKGSTCSPPMLPILPHEVSLNAFGPLPPWSLSAVANADSHTTEDLNAPRYTPSSSVPPVGSGAILPSSMFPFVMRFPSYTTTCASHFVSLPTCMSPSIHNSSLNLAHSL